MKLIWACSALVFALPVSGQTAVTPPAVQDAAPPVAASALAVAIAAKLFPNGTYRKMLDGTFTKMMSGMVDQMGNLPLGDLIKSYGLDPDTAKKLDKATLNQIMAIMDPAYKDRMRLTMDSMFKAMIPLFEQMEPDLRAGLAESLQHRFTTPQLRELRTFFDTSTGSDFASQQMLLFMDPAVMGRMQSQLPRIMQAMPGLVGDAIKATAALPKPKKYSDLTEAERRDLANLLGIDPSKKAK